jgi:hypothetical protein
MKTTDDQTDDCIHHMVVGSDPTQTSSQSFYGHHATNSPSVLLGITPMRTDIYLHKDRLQWLK